MELPKTLYVIVEEPKSAEPWLNCGADVAELVDGNEVAEIGVYELKERREVKRSIVTLAILG